MLPFIFVLIITLRLSHFYLLLHFFLLFLFATAASSKYHHIHSNAHSNHHKHFISYSVLVITFYLVLRQKRRKVNHCKNKEQICNDELAKRTVEQS